MLSTNDLYNKKLFYRSKKGKLKKYGHLRSAVFLPNKPQLAGFMVKRPDVALMIERSNRFVAAESISTVVEDGVTYLVADPKDDAAWDKGACRRLGIDLDACVIWDGMPVVNAKGVSLGTISDVVLDDQTLRVHHIDVSHGSVDRTLLGSADIDASCLLGYRDGAIVAQIEEEYVEVSGGVAAKAGTAWAKGANAAKGVGEKAVDKAADAINDGSYGLGKAVGKQARNLKGAFKDMKREFDKASKGQ